MFSGLFGLMLTLQDMLMLNFQYFDLDRNFSVT